MSFVHTNTNLLTLLERENVQKIEEPQRKETDNTLSTNESDTSTTVEITENPVFDDRHSVVGYDKKYKKDGRQWLHKSRFKDDETSDKDEQTSDDDCSLDITPQGSLTNQINIEPKSTKRETNYIDYGEENAENSREALSDFKIYDDSTESESNLREHTLAKSGEVNVNDDEKSGHRQLYIAPPEFMTVGGKKIPTQATVSLRSGMENAFGGMIKNYLMSSYGLDPKNEIEKGFRIHMDDKDNEDDSTSSNMSDNPCPSSSNSSSSCGSELDMLAPSSPKRVCFNADRGLCASPVCNLGLYAIRSPTPTNRSNCASPWETIVLEEMSGNSCGFCVPFRTKSPSDPSLSENNNNT